MKDMIASDWFLLTPLLTSWHHFLKSVFKNHLHLPLELGLKSPMSPTRGRWVLKCNWVHGFSPQPVQVWLTLLSQTSPNAPGHTISALGDIRGSDLRKWTKAHFLHLSCLAECHYVRIRFWREICADMAGHAHPPATANRISNSSFFWHSRCVESHRIAWRFGQQQHLLINGNCLNWLGCVYLNTVSFV